MYLAFGPSHLRLLAIALSFLPLAGCIPVAYILPKAHYFPPTSVESPPDEVKAVLARASIRSSYPLISSEAKNEIIPLDVSTKGHTQHKFDMTIESGMYLASAISFGCDTCSTQEIRLYRPGYRLITIQAWPAKDNEVNWVAAETLEEQEEALNGLLNDKYFNLNFMTQPPAENPPEIEQANCIMSAMKDKVEDSPTGRDLLMFAANEYSRIACEMERAYSQLMPVAFQREIILGADNKLDRINQLKLKSRAMRDVALNAHSSND